MSFFVYLICAQKKDNSFITYVGCTQTIYKKGLKHIIRQKELNLQEKKWKLIYKKKFVSKKDAMKYEYVLKKIERIEFY